MDPIDENINPIKENKNEMVTQIINILFPILYIVLIIFISIKTYSNYNANPDAYIGMIHVAGDSIIIWSRYLTIIFLLLTIGINLLVNPKNKWVNIIRMIIIFLIINFLVSTLNGWA